jgi:phosphoribosylformimino-5-aminoimidazole carboxamide ribotide isomerase
MAAHWVECGAERLHLVDLDGAVEGRPVNRDLVKSIVGSVPVPVELGGGIRDMKTIDSYLSAGVRWVILGTVAYKDPVFAASACERFPGQVILGIDARDNKVAVEGWMEETAMTASEMAKQFETRGLAAIIYTDIHRDGMGTGPNVEATRGLARNISVGVIASGGISGIEDVLSLLPLSEDGVIGMITGRALYEGKLDLRQAIEISKSGNFQKKP